jgi:hypothetical protein
MLLPVGNVKGCQVSAFRMVHDRSINPNFIVRKKKNLLNKSKGKQLNI